VVVFEQQFADQLLGFDESVEGEFDEAAFPKDEFTY
jgi:hypothetical protein